MKSRFDLEEEITQLHTFTDQLGTLSEGILERDLSKDEIVNVIEGLRVMINLHTDKLYDTMCQCFNLNGYKDDLK